MPENPEETGTLWLVATPIGTIGDLSPRATEVLRSVDMILAEDTRRARRLLSHAGIRAGRRLRSLHDHNEDRQGPKVVAALQDGRSAALLSDAGTPVLSDPGYGLVRGARRVGVAVRSVPGPSAFTSGLAASGQPPLPATLVGFLPPRMGPRRRRIAELAVLPGTLVILLSPHRLSDELRDLAEGLGRTRPATLLAELSKLHERAMMAELGVLASGSESAGPRGEYVVVVGPSDDVRVAEATPDQVRAAYRLAIADGLERSAALAAVARGFGIRKRQVFTMLVDDEKPAEEQD